MKKHFLSRILMVLVLAVSCLESVAAPSATVIPLSQWLNEQVKETNERRKTYPPKSRIPKFSRELFGGWVNADAPADCFDSRQEALIRDLEPGADVKFYPGNKCRILEGKWWDPYTNQFLHRSDEIDIDHIVALQHTYYYGGFKWTPAERCHYANYLGNNYHLLTVSAKENRSKGADDPRMYMPPNKEFACTYIKMWMKIKMVWDLDVDPQEATWLVQNAKAYKCDARQFVIGKREYAEQLTLRNQVSQACINRMK